MLTQQQRRRDSDAETGQAEFLSRQASQRHPVHGFDDDLTATGGREQPDALIVGVDLMTGTGWETTANATFTYLVSIEYVRLAVTLDRRSLRAGVSTVVSTEGRRDDPATGHQTARMKLTIDSSEGLADVMRVVGSLYGVTLAVSDIEISAASLSEPASPRRARARTGTRSTRQRRPPADRGDARAVRERAVANGCTVSARGSLSAAVRDAFAAAHAS